MTTRKTGSKKPTTRKRTYKKPSNVIKEVTTIEQRGGDGLWSKIITVKYIKQLVCPSFLKTELIAVIAVIPLIILIIFALWRLLGS